MNPFKGEIVINPELQNTYIAAIVSINYRIELNYYNILKQGNTAKYGVIVVNEQTAYQTPGNSHSSRQASSELQYASITGDQSGITNAIRQLNWATYMVDNNGKNCYPRDEVWMTDGYGDYIRHYLRSMAYNPELAPAAQNHLLWSTSVIQLMEYKGSVNKFLQPEIPIEMVKDVILNYRTYDNKGEEIIRLTQKPTAVLVNKNKIVESPIAETESWSWKPLNRGGIITVKHTSGNMITILANL